MKPLDDREGIRRLAVSYQESKVLLVAVRLGVFTALDENEAGAGELAGTLGCDGRGLELLLNALVAMGLLTKRDGRFGSTAAASRFLAGGAETMAPLFRHQGQMWENWSRLEGLVAAKRREDTAEERREDFLGAMAVNGRLGAPLVVDSLDLDGVKSVLDLGGGPGCYAAALLRRRPGVQVTLFDRAETLPFAERFLDAGGLAGKVRLLGGDLFRDPLGEGYDLVLASNLVHIFDEARAALILSRSFAALAPGGRLALNDFFLDSQRVRPRRAAVFALHMLVAGEGGRTYSFEETAVMMREAGFEDVTTRPVTEQSSLVTGRRPENRG